MSNEIFASSCPTFPNVSFFDGHIRNHMGIFGVHYGDPDFLLNIPRPQDALPPPNGYHKLKQGDLDHPLWLNHQFAYLCLLPRSNPFRGPIFECLDVKMWKLPIERCLPSFHSEEERFGLAQATIDRWWRLESLLRMMLDKMTGFYTGEMPKGLTHFTYPLLYGYKQRNAYTEQQARKSAIRSRDAFLPLMARITLMYILLDATDSGDWRAALQRSTRLPWQWFDDMEASAVGNLNIDRMGGIFDLTLVRSDPYQYLPRHARWLFSFLISKQRVPLYFFYGQQFPLTDQQPIPPALSDRGFVPDAAEVSYLRSLPGDVAFSRWSSRALPWTSLRNVSSGSSNSLGLISAPISSPSLNRPAASDFGTARYFPPVDPDSGQLPGEDIHAFLERRKLRNEQQLENDTEMRKKTTRYTGRHCRQKGGSARPRPNGSVHLHLGRRARIFYAAFDLSSVGSRSLGRVYSQSAHLRLVLQRMGSVPGLGSR
ncbi:hypothetical protein C8F01DRAFT_332019 [Mycena amicta]|nr:hypothetical protein C8F01DRAFT_332019 [Mycena amicta]